MGGILKPESMSATASNRQSPLFAETETFIAQEYERLRRTKIDPWSFLTAGPPFRCTDFYGREISYQGVAFEGSPHDVFWGGFIEPFLRDLVVRAINHTAGLAAERGIEPRAPILEAAGLLKSKVSAAYHRMRDIDQRLRGAGYPDRVTPRSVNGYVDQMNTYVDQIVTGRLAPKPLLKRLSDFYRAHPVVFWAVGLIVSVLIAVAL